MTEISSKERILRTIRHEEPDRVPISPRYYDYLHGTAGCSCWEHYLRFGQKMGIDPMLHVYPEWNNYLLRHGGLYDDLPGVKVEVEITNAPDRTLVRRRFHTPAGELTDLRQIPTKESLITFDHMIETLVKGREDLDKIPFILPKAETAYMGNCVLAREMVGDQYIVECRPTQGTDQFLVDAVGVEGAFLLYYDDRPMLEELVRIFNARTQAIMKRALDAGMEMIFDAWYNASMSVGWSPKQFAQLFLPHIRANVELTHQYGALYHYYDDGKMDKTLDMLADAGVDVIETLSPPPMGDVDLASAKARIGDTVCLKGNVDQVNVILPGTPAEIRQAVEETIAIGAPGGGFILCTSDSIRPETPWENVEAFFSAAREFARKAYR
jgi:hypothetical protein